MERYKTARTVPCPEIYIEGTSETIPGLAPDLQTLMAAAIEGEPLPRTGVPQYDADEDTGFIRASVADLPPEDILLAHLTATAKPEQQPQDGGESASPEEEEAPSEAKE